MAAVVLTVGQVHGHHTPNGFVKDSANKQVFSCFIALTAVAGTYAAADDATASALNTAIQNSRRDGRTATVLQASMAAPGKKADGTVIGIGAGTVAANVYTAPLTQADLTTEHANGALTDTFLEPIVIHACYVLS